MSTGECLKCHKVGVLTIHHVCPRRFFGENNDTILIDRNCHNEIEKIIPLFEQLSREEYHQLTTGWLNDDQAIINYYRHYAMESNHRFNPNTCHKKGKKKRR